MFEVQGYYAKRLWIVSHSCRLVESVIFRPELKNMSSLRILLLSQLEGRRRWLLYFYCIALPIGLMAGIRSVLSVSVIKTRVADSATQWRT